MASYHRPTCYVHIGIHKTGSTSIQRTLAMHRDLLRKEHHVNYLPFGGNHGAVISSLFQKGDRIRPRSDEAESRHSKGWYLSQLAAHLSDHTKRTIISGEKLSSMKPKEVARFHSFLKQHADGIQVIAYVRNPIDWASSWSQQVLKQGRKTLSELYENPPVVDFEGHIGAFIDSFGRDNVDIRVFEQAIAHPDGLVGDFLGCIGLPGVQGFAMQRNNESLSRECVLLLDEVQSCRPLYLGKGRHYSPGRCDQDANDLLLGIPGQKFMLPVRSLRYVCEHSKKSCEWLTMQLGRDPYPNLEIPQQPEATESWSPATVRALGLRLFDLHVRCRELEAQVSNSFRNRSLRFAAKLWRKLVKRLAWFRFPRTES